MPPPITTYTDAEVEAALNNSTIALMRWSRLENVKAVRGKTLREFVEALVETLTEDVLQDEKTGKMLLPPEELVLALQAAAQAVVYKYVISDAKARKTFVNLMQRGV